MVLAFGGGAFLDPRTREATRAEAVSVWLRCTLPTLVRRVATRDNRPLLAGRDAGRDLGEIRSYCANLDDDSLDFAVVQHRNGVL